jgi:signal transduction histidine kinase
MSKMTGAFNLTRQFALLSFLCILSISLVSGWVLSRFLTDTLLTREATLSQEFVDSIVQTEGTWKYFLDGRREAGRQILDSFFGQLANMPDVVRANVYGADLSVLWSSDAALIGQRFGDNDELESALSGNLIFESGIVGHTEKAEHHDLEPEQLGLRFVETYIPIWDGQHTQVVGAVELYKLPRVLQESITRGQRLVWFNALFGGVLLFLSLFWIVMRANHIMMRQHQRLLESENLSMIGETASAVAHSMRNPLASIRASAELTLTDDLEGARESAADIISEADRLDRWARELLQFSGSDHGASELIDLPALVHEVLEEHRALLERTHVALQVEMSDKAAVVEANRSPLSQVVGNLITNAVEAMGGDGTLTVSIHQRGTRPGMVVLSISDTGGGLAPEIRDKLFRPFSTTKPNGTGLGLALSKRLIERYLGTLEIDNNPGVGVSAVVSLPIAR